jgi:hypothetical protein
VIAFQSDLLFGFISTPVGILFIVAGFREMSRAIDSEDWPEVAGEIEETGVVSAVSARGGVTYAPLVRYHYRVGENQYVSDRIAFGGTASMTFRFWAEGLADRYRQTKTVSVRVNPKDPTLSVLEAGVHWTVWFIIAIGTLFTGLGISSLLTHLGILGG